MVQSARAAGAACAGKRVAGQTLRGAKGADGSQVHLLADVAGAPGIVAAQTEVGVKTMAREHLHQVREGQGRSSVVLRLVGFAHSR